MNAGKTLLRGRTVQKLLLSSWGFQHCTVALGNGLSTLSLWLLRRCSHTSNQSYTLNLANKYKWCFIHELWNFILFIGYSSTLSLSGRTSEINNFFPSEVKLQRVRFFFPETVPLLFMERCVAISIKKKSRPFFLILDNRFKLKFILH